MLKRKDKGILDQFLPAIVVIVLLAVLWTGSMISASNIDRSSDIHQVARTYLLRMEADGYLTEENRNLMMVSGFSAKRTHSIILYCLLPTWSHRRQIYEPVQKRSDKQLLSAKCPYDADRISGGLCTARNP